VQTRILEETSIVKSDQWIARVRPPTEPWNGRIVLLLHGWTGDENIMWLFARKLPVHCWMVAPRGPVESPDGGFAWAVPQNGIRPGYAAYLQQAEKLIDHLKGWVPDYSPETRLDMIGFSQGAAMTYVLTLATTPTKVAPLAGYLPSGLDEHFKNRDFSSLQMFLAHNTDDKMVSVEESRKASTLFRNAGASVQYCENTGGHKVSTACFNALDAFMSN
jgi:phospholipase/carboxylesterase